MLGIIFSFSTNRQSRQKRVLTFHLDYFLMLSFLSLRAFFLKWKMREENIQLKTLPIPVAFLAAFDNATAADWFSQIWKLISIFGEDLQFCFLRISWDLICYSMHPCLVTSRYVMPFYVTLRHLTHCHVISCRARHVT